MNVIARDCAQRTGDFVNQASHGGGFMTARDWPEHQPGTVEGSPGPAPSREHLLEFLAGEDEAFDRSLRELRRELAPASWAEQLLVDHIVLAASRLRSAAHAVDRERCSHDHVVLTEVAGRTMAEAFDQLGKLRAHRQWTGHAPGPAAARRPPVGDDFNFSARETDDELDLPGSAEAGVPAMPGWASRLSIDEAVSTHSPVVRGTRVTACRVVSLVVDGHTWSDILKAHPELTEADLRACLDYTLDQEGHVQLGR